MAALAVFAGLILITLALWNMLVTATSMRVAEQFCLTRVFYRSTWRAWSAAARRMIPGRRRDMYLSLYAPLSVLLLVGVWAVSLILGFANLHWAFGSQRYGAETSMAAFSYIQMSSATFFPLPTSSVSPHTPLVRGLIVTQSAVGFLFCATVGAYLLVLRREFQRRTAIISFVDEHAGVPPAILNLLRRSDSNESVDELVETLRDWERSAAELMLSNDIHPVLCYCRSPRTQRSWFTALIIIMDTSALVLAAVNDAPARQARYTFSIARRAVIGMAHFSGTPTCHPLGSDRHLFVNLAELHARLAAAEDTTLCSGSDADEQFIVWQATYEPYVYALADYLLMPVPLWHSTGGLHN